MPQMLLPLFSPGVNEITNLVGYERRDGKVWYFLGQLPLFSHEEKDIESFKFITSQLVISGHVKQADIVRAFGVTPNSIKRNVKRLREGGIKGFSRKKKRKKKKTSIMTEEVLTKAQEFINRGCNSIEIGEALSIKPATIRKAISVGRLEKKD